MRVKRELWVLVWLVILIAAAGPASSPVGAQTWSMTVAAGGGSVSQTDLQRTPPNQVTGDTATVQVTCQTAADCGNVGLQLQRGTTVVQTLGRGAGGNFQVPAGPVRGTVLDLAITFNRGAIDSFPVTAGGTSTPQTAPTNTAQDTGDNAPLSELLTTTCADATVTVGYDEKENQGQILVTPTGNVLARGTENFDENDTLDVIVYGDARLLPQLKVERISNFRDAQTVRIVGGGLTLPSQLIARQGAGVCTTSTYTLADFAPGQGKVQISAFQNNEWLPLGTFDFNVDPLYTGILSLGAAWTDAVDPGYKLASNGSETVIALGDDGKEDLLYTLFYTPYVWGKRDLEKRIPRSQWYKHINPTVGIVPEDIDENAMVGATIDLPAGFLFTFGWHFRRISVLPEDTGLTVGSPFTGTADQIPTAKSWENEKFFAVTVDLRAMLQLLNAALPGGGGS